MSNSKIVKGISKNLPEITDKAIRAIGMLTGESQEVLAQKSRDEIFQQLSFLLRCEKDKLLKLLIEHDQNQELDLLSILKMWQLVNKGKVPGKKREFKGMEDETYKHLKILFSRLGDEARYRVENLLGSASSDINFSSVNSANTTRKPLIVMSGGLQVLLNKATSHAQAVNNNQLENTRR
jgi:hypothetical protein